MAGLAYDSHTKDIRPRDFLVAGQTRDPITLDTYWVDVQEYQTYKTNNQFYLATKYGGFKVPRGYDFENNTTPLPLASWHSNTDINNGQPRPDNYFSGGRPDLVLAGLNSAFADIASKIKSYTTSFSTSLPQVAVAGNSSFSSQFDASDWKGEVKASELRFDANGEPSLIDKWTFSSLLAAQLAGTGWNSNRRVATWNPDTRTGVAFRSAALAASQRSALDPTFTAASDADPLLDYLRGDRTNEVGSSVVGSSQAYRTPLRADRRHRRLEGAADRPAVVPVLGRQQSRLLGVQEHLGQSADGGLRRCQRRHAARHQRQPVRSPAGPRCSRTSRARSTTARTALRASTGWHRSPTRRSRTTTW